MRSTTNEPDANGVTPAEYRQLVIELRAKQGLPPSVEDPDTLDAIARIFDTARARAHPGAA